MRLTLILFLSTVAFAEAPAPNPELDAAKARIAWLEQKIAATESKSRACFEIYSADMTLNNLSKQEPPKAQEPKKTEDKK